MQPETKQQRHIPGVPDEIIPDISHLITEDDEPVDNFFSEKQQRLLVEPLYASWQPLHPKTQQPRLFLATANVGIYYALREPPLVPDVMLSLDVEAPADWWEKHNRCYMMWEFGKTPELVIEIISNLKGNELVSKMERYAQSHIQYYAVFDPSNQYGSTLLRLFSLQKSAYVPVEALDSATFPLQLMTWEGSYEGRTAEWLRWADQDGTFIPTGRERAESEKYRAENEKYRAEREKQRAENEKQRAENEKQRAEREKQRAESAELLLAKEREEKERLAAKLRALGLNPDES